MTKDALTGIVYSEKELAWESFMPARNGVRRIDEGLVERPQESDEESEEGASQDISEWVARVKKECGELKGDITLCFYSENVLLRVVDLPPVPDEELADVVLLQVDKFSPFPVDNMVVSYEVLVRSDESCKVLIGAIKRKVADAAGAVLNAAGIYPKRVDVSALARWRILKDAGKIEPKGRHIILILEKRMPELLVMHDGLPVFFRAFAAEAELEGAEFEDELIGEISYTLMSLSLEEHDVEFETHADVWHYGSVPQGLATKLAEECSCDVSINSMDSLSSLAEGVVIRSTDRDGVMDLTPASWKQADTVRIFKKKMMMVVSVLLGIWILVAGGFFGALSVREHQLKLLKKKKEKWHDPAMEVRDLRKRAQTIEGYFDRSKSALESLREVSAHLPSGIDLSSFIFRKNVEKKLETVSLDGLADTRPQILEFQENLNKSELFVDVKSGPVKPSRGGKYQFDFEMTLTPQDEEE